MDYNHAVIHTGGNIYNDYVSDFDSSGRIIIVSEGGIRLFDGDRNYQIGANPIVWASGPALDVEAKCHDCGAWSDYDAIGTVCGHCRRGVIGHAEYEPLEDDSQIADIELTTEYIFIRDMDGATLLVYRNTV